MMCHSPLKTKKKKKKTIPGHNLDFLFPFDDANRLFAR